MEKKFTQKFCRHLLAAGMLTSVWLVSGGNASAQLSTNPDKFLGNITTRGQVDYGNEKFYQLWNQITGENESKWSSIEGSRRGSFSWGGSDNCYNYAKNHKFPFKFHTLIWGSQYPGWMDNLSTSEQYKAIVEWMDAIKAHYPTIDLIDVVNEAVSGHAPAPYRAALGGEGKTGYDWIIKAFEMAHERWPDAILIYNDYNTFQWQRSQFIDLVRTLRDAGAPIDAYGCQSHDLTDMSEGNFKSAMVEIQNALKMPMYSSEYDIGTTDDNLQLQRYKEQIPYMWEADYCAGITLWGYIYGATWTTDGNSGIIRNGQDRPAMQWLREYMQTEKAKTAKSPFPGMKKEASLYVKPASLSVTKDEPVNITIRARLRTKTIDHIDLYVNNKLEATFTEAPYVLEYTPATLGKYNLKAVLVATDGTEYERLSGFTAYKPRAPYNGGTDLPGTLQAENFDSGADGISFHDSDTQSQGGTSYRTDIGGVDIVTCSTGYAIGYTVTGEWLEYTVNVKEAGIYSYDASVSSGSTTSSIKLSLADGNEVRDLTPVLPVPCVQANNWDTYRTLHGRLAMELTEGTHVIRLNITGGNCNIDRIIFRHVEVDNGMQISLTSDPAPSTVNTTTLMKATASSTTSTIANVKFYLNNVLQRTVTQEPYQYAYRPTEKGTYSFFAIATDAEGRQSKIANYAMVVNNQRIPHKGVIEVPGSFEAEDFDRGGEGLTFHDSDSKDEEGTGYRNDNEGLDIVKSGSGYVIGYTAAGEWMEYTINVTQGGRYSFEATVSSGVTGSGFTIALADNGTVLALARVTVPQTGSNTWDNYRIVKGVFSRELEPGQHILRFTINGANCNIDKINLICTTPTAINSVVSDSNHHTHATYNIMGVKVDGTYRGITIQNGKKVLVK